MLDKRKCEHCGHIHICAPHSQEQTKTGGYFGPALARPPPHYMGNPAKQTYFNYIAKAIPGQPTRNDFKHGGNGKDKNISFRPQVKDNQESSIPPEALPREEGGLPQPLGTEQQDEREQIEDGRMIGSSELERELMSEFNRNKLEPTYPKFENPDQVAPPPDNQSQKEQTADQHTEVKKKKKGWTNYKDWKPPEGADVQQ